MTTVPPDPNPPAPSHAESTVIDLRSPRGIAGWLALFVVGLAVSALVLVVQLPDTVSTLHGETWALGNQVSLFRPLLVFEALGHVAILAGAVGALGLIWGRHPSTPRFVQIYLLSVLVYGVVQLATIPGVYADLAVLARNSGASTDELDDARLEATTSSGRTALYAIVWLLYWLKSRRVANTFTPSGVMPRGA